MDTKCSIGLVSVTVANVAEFAAKAGLDAEQMMRDSLDTLLRLQADDRSLNATYTATAFATAVEEVARKAMTQKPSSDFILFKSTGGRLTGVEKGSKAYNRNAFLVTMNSQHALAKTYSRLLGQVRSWNDARKGGKLGPETLYKELVARMTIADEGLRIIGFPPVAVSNSMKGDLHAAYISFGDIADIFLKNGSAEQMIAAVQRSWYNELNIPVQQVTEAGRYILERQSKDLVLENADQIEEFTQELTKKLSSYEAYSADEAIRAIQVENEAWMQSAEGQKIARGLAEVMASPSFRSALAEREVRNTILSLSFAKADGFQMSAQMLKTIGESEWNGEVIEQLGAFLFDDTIRRVFGNDVKVKAMIDEAPLAFAQQWAAQIAASLHPNDLAVLMQEWTLIKASRTKSPGRKSGGKTSNKANVNKAKKQNDDAIAELAAKKAAEDVETVEAARASESSLEAAQLSQTFYNELRYGSVVGGMAKLLSKVSDRAFMGSKGKAMVIGAEHISLENAARISEALAKFRDDVGGDIEMINRIYNNLRKAGPTEDSMKAVIAGLPEAERRAAEEMVKMIDQMFGIGNVNKLMRNGIFTEELAKNLGYVGLGRFSDQFVKAQSADEVLDYWKTIELQEGDDILSIMGKFYTAQQLSMIPSTIANSAVRHFSHTNYGLTTKEALAQGWRPLNDKGTLGKFMDYGDKEPALFPNEIATRLELIEKHLNYNRQIDSKMWNNIIGNVDAVTSIMKSSLTVWRPGHHMVSALGNLLMNSIDGVTPNDYIYGLKLLIRDGQIGDVDVRALDEMMAQNAPEGYKLRDGATETIQVNINGKLTTVNMDELVYAMNVIGGVPISPRRVRDTPAEELESSSKFFENLAKKPGFKQIAGVDHLLGKASAVRDNFFRLAMFTKELRKGGPYSSLEDAYLAAAAKVHEFHPTVGTLTGWERKYARRAFYFYTWQKQAFFKILEVAANRPDIITMPSKVQFAIATSQGLEPESFGDPFAASRLWAGYNENSLYGPQWEDDVWGAMGVKPASPQMDVIDAYLSSITFKPEDGLWENIGNMGGQALNSFLTRNAAPAIVMGSEIISGREAGEFGQPLEAKGMGEYLIDKTGLGTLSRVFGVTPWGPRSDVDLTPYGKENRERLWSNWWSGMKWTYYESPAALRTARQEEIDYWQKTLESGKYAPKLSPYDIGQGLGQ